jgi:hypothetical protein
MLRARIPQTAGSTPRRAALHGVATALLVAAIGFDLAFVATGSRSGLSIAFGLGLLIPMVVLVPMTLHSTSELARLRAIPTAPTAPAPDMDAERLVERLVERPVERLEVAVPVQEPVALDAGPTLAPWVLDLGGALVRVRHELDVHARRLDTAIREGRLWGLGVQAPHDDAWFAVRDVVGRAEVGGLVLHDPVADAYAEIGRVARVNALRLLTGASSDVVHADRLPEALDAVEWALDQLDLVIGVVAQDAMPPAFAERSDDLESTAALPDAGSAAVLDLTEEDRSVFDAEPELASDPATRDAVSS